MQSLHTILPRLEAEIALLKEELRVSKGINKKDALALIQEQIDKIQMPKPEEVKTLTGRDVLSIVNKHQQTIKRPDLITKSDIAEIIKESVNLNYVNNLYGKR